MCKNSGCGVPREDGQDGKGKCCRALQKAAEKQQAKEAAKNDSAPVEKSAEKPAEAPKGGCGCGGKKHPAP